MLPNMRYWYSYLLLLFIVDVSLAQQAMLRGFVTDNEDGQPIELVNVFLEGIDLRQRGTSTNNDGIYVIPRIDPGRYALNASFIGYRTFQDTLVFAPGESVSFDIVLEREGAELDEVVVEGERNVGMARVIAGQQTIRPEDITLIPTPDAAGDLASYLTTLPGVIVTGDRGGQLFIRGGEPAQNLVQIDGILLYQPFHIVGFYSAFPSDILSRTDIYAGGFGSKFGERISSVLDIATRDGNKQRIVGGVSASPFIGTARLEGPLIKDRVSFIASGRHSLLESVADQYISEPTPYSFNDAFVKVNGIISRNSRASVTALQTSDRGVLNPSDDREPDEVTWSNRAVGARYLFLPRVSPLMMDFKASYSRLDTDLGPSGIPNRSSFVDNFNFSLDATVYGEETDVDAGVSVRIISQNSVLNGLYQNINVQDEQFEHGAVYAEPEFNFSNGLQLRIGTRLQFFDSRFHPFFEPRLRVVWDRGVSRWSAAFGVYNQSIIGIYDRRDAASVFTVWTNVPRERDSVEDSREGRVQQAIHFITGYQAQVLPWLEVSAEAYYKRLQNLFIAEWTAYPRFTTNLQPAKGRAYGFDLRAESRRGAFYGYINYGYSNTRYTALQEAIPLWYGTQGLGFRPPHDRRHQLNVLLSTSLGQFDASLRWDFGSGLPFSQAIGFDGFALIDDIEKASEIEGFRRVIYEEPFNALLPTYHRLDFSIDRTFGLRSGEVTIQASIINVYDRNNLFFLDIFTLERTDQLPFIPSLGFKMDFGGE